MPRTKNKLRKKKDIERGMDKRKILCIVLIIVAILIAILDSPNSRQWKLAIQWRPTLCQNSTSCQQPILEKFTIHGLWNFTPCPTHGRPLPRREIERLQSTLKLNIVWPDFTNISDNNIRFWQHEWSKHGHCTNMTPMAYFQKAINVYDLYPVLTYLEVQGIRPGDQLRIEEFYNAVYRERGFRPKVVCNNENQITEFRICFDTVGFIGHDAVNCGGSPYQTCKSDENATLPKA
ncbi:Ribonuclease T2-like [Dillenia turbinata]|uniref:Ribonuclease T2-like n=1 Tax=Dillenia turbinata TaxID=194707 RepID=A0AAN8V4V2_9MAGN